MPDVHLQTSDGRSILIEATHITTQQVTSSDALEASLKKKERQLNEFFRHPVYNKIRDKAEQTSRWHENKMSNHAQDPVVLVIGVSQNLYQLNLQDEFSSVEMRKPVYSALADNNWWNLSRIMMYSNDRSWPNDRTNQQVNHAHLISAVILVPLRDKHEVLPYRSFREADPFLVHNPTPTVRLTKQQELLLKQINFNEVRYSTGRQIWEEWGATDTKVPDILERYRREAYWDSSFRYSFSSEGAFRMTIPTKLVVRLIAEDISAKAFRRGNPSDDIWESLKAAALFGQQIADIRYLSPKEAPDNKACLEIVFSEFNNLRRRQNDIFHVKYSTTDSGTLDSIQLSAETFVALIASEIPDQCIWQGADRQATKSALLNAMKDDQDIAAVSLNDRSFEKNITIKFGLATIPTIRAVKKK